MLPTGEAVREGVWWVAVDAGPGFGSTVVQPQHLLGDGAAAGRLFLPFQADWLLRLEDGRPSHAFYFRDFLWREAVASPQVIWSGDGLVLLPPTGASNHEPRKAQWFSQAADGTLAQEHVYATRMGTEVYLPKYYRFIDGDWHTHGRFGAFGERPVVYQMLPRLFGNTNETRRINGTLEENGVGKFSDLSETVIRRFRDEGITHIWLTGVLRQATSTDYSDIGLPPDDPDLLKGIAGSPYAIKDYFDVSPDYADDPAQRLEEFRALLERTGAAGMGVVIDLVANHVARSYESTVRPDLSFGNNDRTDVFFDPRNNFFYLTPEVTPPGEGPPLRLPTVDPTTGEVVSETAALVGGADGLYDPERRIGRVTGNDVVSWRPSMGDWYETVKLNFGYNFLDRNAAPEYPSAVTPEKAIPDTWLKMDKVVAYWQELGVDGFRADMAHMVPPEFWKWLIHRARQRDPEVFFFAEAYNDDPAKVASREPVLDERDGVMIALLDAGFASVYDDPGYDALEALYEGKAWANDLAVDEWNLGPFFFDCAIRYAENHDEPRLAHPDTWGGVGMEVGPPVTAALLGHSRGPVMIYHGQEVGEPAIGREGFGGDDTRTTIFDYWSMPEFNKWWNNGALDGGGLSPQQQELRAWYVGLLEALRHPAFTKGTQYPLNPANVHNPFFGKIEDLGPSGHWLYAYLRHDPGSGALVLVTVNLNPVSTMHHVRIRIPSSTWQSIGLAGGDGWLNMRDLLAGDVAESLAMGLADARREGIYIPELPPLTARYWVLWLAGEAQADARQAPPFYAGSAYLGAPPLLRMEAGGELAVDLRRFGNPGTSHHFAVKAMDGMAVDLDRLNHRLTLNADPALKGLVEVRLFLLPNDGEDVIAYESILPVAVQSMPRQRFTYRAADSAGRVSVVGDFNQWNAESHIMTRENGGLYAIEIALAPGTYRYKFVVDGNYLEDPVNRNREPDGYGGYNSLITLEGTSADVAPNLFFKEAREKSLLFWGTPVSAGQQVVAHALPPRGGALPLQTAVRDGVVFVANSDLEPGSRVRVIAASPGGAVGIPAMFYPGDLAELWEAGIIYYAFTDRFYDGNPANTVKVDDERVADIANYKGGDLEGITRRLKEGYFDDLGVNILWLAPLNRNPPDAWQEYLPPYRFYTGYHGYWPVDSRAVEPRFGGDQALRDLVAGARESNVRVIADLVLKHVHATHPLAEDRPDLFGRLELPDGSRNLRRWNDRPFTTWFEPFLPGFDFDNPEAVEVLLDDSEYWIAEYGLDGYRLDAVKHIRPDFWWRFRSRLRDAFPDRDLYFVGETFHDREGIADFVGPNMLDGQFDFPLYDTLMDVFARETAGMDALERALLASESVYGKTSRMSPLLGNHDKARFMAYADGDLPDPNEPDAEEVGWLRPPQVDDPRSYEKLKMAMTFLLTIDGIPMIYYGDEIGMTGAGDPDNRRMMRFGYSVSADEAMVKTHFSRLAHTRRQHPSLYAGSRRPLLVDADRYAFVRAYGEDRALVLFNRSGQTARFDLDLSPEIHSADMRDVISGRVLSVRSGKTTVTLPPRESAVFILE